MNLLDKDSCSNLSDENELSDKCIKFLGILEDPDFLEIIFLVIFSSNS
jgi:hypothetical protein